MVTTAMAAARAEFSSAGRLAPGPGIVDALSVHGGAVGPDCLAGGASHPPDRTAKLTLLSKRVTSDQLAVCLCCGR